MQYGTILFRRLQLFLESPQLIKENPFLQKPDDQISRTNKAMNTNREHRIISIHELISWGHLSHFAPEATPAATGATARSPARGLRQTRPGCAWSRMTRVE